MAIVEEKEPLWEAISLLKSADTEIISQRQEIASLKNRLEGYERMFEMFSAGKRIGMPGMMGRPDILMDINSFVYRMKDPKTCCDNTTEKSE